MLLDDPRFSLFTISEDDVNYPEAYWMISNSHPKVEKKKKTIAPNTYIMCSFLHPYLQQLYLVRWLVPDGIIHLVISVSVVVLVLY